MYNLWHTIWIHFSDFSVPFVCVSLYFRCNFRMSFFILLIRTIAVPLFFSRSLPLSNYLRFVWTLRRCCMNTPFESLVFLFLFVQTTHLIRLWIAIYFERFLMFHTQLIVASRQQMSSTSFHKERSTVINCWVSIWTSETIGVYFSSWRKTEAKFCTSFLSSSTFICFQDT